MSSYIPIFPLKLVAYPSEQVNLHIFEPRYRQLIHDIKESGGIFGIAVYIDKLMPFGTEVRLQEISNVYEDGRMDIKTLGVRVFEMITFDNPASGKLYAGGKVVYQENDPSVAKNIYDEFVFFLKEFFRLIGYEIDLSSALFSSFTVAHKLGLKIEEEYELLRISSESDRQQFLIKHLKRIIPVMRDLEKAKDRIRQNGHFKNLDPLDF